MQGLFKVDQDFYYGRITSLFVADIDEITSAHGLTIWLHDKVGKHSEIDFEINENTFKLISTDPVLINALKQTSSDKDHIMGLDLKDYIADAKYRATGGYDDY